MEYKGYSAKLTGVYKIERGKKLYSLLITKNDEEVLRTDHLYTNELRAFKDAKEMIDKNDFSTNIIRLNTNKENNKNDKIHMSTKINKLIHKLLIANVILLIISYSLILFLVIMINKNIFFLLAYPLFGLLITLIILYWGVFAKKEIILNKKQKRFYSIVWWINLLYNHGPFITYNDQPFEGKKKGWYSANAMGLLLIETFLFLTIVFNFINLDHNIVFNFTNFDLNMLLVCFWIISYILLLINYGLSIAWEITDANTRGEGFPHNKIITPIISVIVLVTSIYILFRIFR